MYDFPNVRHRTAHRIGLLRETLQCSHCGATMRDRTLAYALLSLINRGKNLPGRSIADLSKQDQMGARCLDTDSFSQMSRLLKHLPDHVRSSFVTNVSFGTELEVNRYNINLEKIDFPAESFDIVLTSDVAEHIRDIDQAHREIYRILRNGGAYIFTVPYDPECATHHVLVDTSSSQDKYLVPAQLHGDPLTGGILAYRVFGRQIFVDLETIGFTVEFLEVNDVSLGIFDGDVFIATRKES
jgi:SAM-dependent methyltransferase